MERLHFLRLSSVAAVVALAVAGCSRTADVQEPPANAAANVPAAESAPAAAEPANVNAFQIGQLSALAVRDGGIELPNDNKVFGVGRTPDEVAAVLSAAGLATDKLQLSIHPLLVKTTDRVLLFDTGAGSNFGPGAGQLLASLNAASVDAQSVTDIFISHVHGDHVGGLVNAEGRLAFPNSTIHMSRPEWDYLKSLSPEKAKGNGIENHAALVAAIEPRLHTFAPGSELVPGVVKAVEIKGHTPGHSGYKISSGQDSILYVGDSMHHFVVSVQKPEWICGFDGDGPTAAASRAALLTELAASGQRVYAVHFPFPGVGKIEGRGVGFVWAAE
jgi:glyoxylase-like metal-dependent hydrolase (beta-lactamase superfamily II)